MIENIVLYKERIKSITFSILILFSIIKILSVTKLEFNIIQYRVIYTRTFEDYLIDPLIDALLIYASSIFLTVYLKKIYLTLVLSILFVLSIINNNLMDLTSSSAAIIVSFFLIKERSINFTSLYYIIFIILIFEAASLLRWSIHPLFPSLIYEDQSWKVAFIEAKLFYLLGIISPLLMLLILFSFFIKPYIKRVIEINDRNGLLNHRLLLFLSLLFSIILSIYPYIPTINPDFKGVSIDEKYYLQWIEQSKSESIFTIADGSRPLTLLLIISLQSFTGLPSHIVIRFLPLILAPLLSISIYTFIKYSIENKIVASIASLLTLSSYQFVIGIYAGFFANWLALITSYLAFLFAVKALKRNKKIDYLLLSIASITTLFIHIYTWSYLIATLLLYTIISVIIYRKEIREKYKGLILLAIIIASNIVIDNVRAYYINSMDTASINLKIAKNSIGMNYFLSRWNNLETTFKLYVGGHFTNSIMLILVFVWIINARYGNPFDRIILSSIFIGLIPTLFGDIVMQTRMFYNMPIQIATALAIYPLTYGSSLRKLIFISIILHLFNYTLRALANSYLLQ
ncbi:MAG: hypothetical protein QW416_04575 [Candidatus Nitrosocaldaceae archaeon]